MTELASSTPGTLVSSETGSFREVPDIASSSDDYSRRFSGPVGSWLLKVQQEKVCRLLAPLPKRLRILDVGGGHAQLTPFLADQGHDVVVLGSTPGCAKRVTPWLRSHRARFVAGDLLNLPLADQSFDVVLAFRLLPHLNAWQRFVAQLCRVAKHSVILDFPSLRSINFCSAALFGIKQRIEHNTRPFDLFLPNTVERVFHGAGFSVVTTEAQFFFPMVLHRALGSVTLARTLEKPAQALGLTHLFGSPLVVRAQRRTLL